MTDSKELTATVVAAAIEAGVKTILSAVSSGFPVPTRGAHKIVDESPGHGHQSMVSAVSDWEMLAFKLHDEIEGTREYATYFQVARIDQRVHKHRSGGSSFDPSMSLLFAVSEAIARRGGPDPDPSTAASVANEFVRFLNEESVEYLVRVPLLGLVVDTAHPNVLNGLELKPLSKSDREALLDEEDHKVWRVRGRSPHAWAELRKPVSVPKWEPHSFNWRIQVQADVDAVVTALRIHLGRHVKPTEIISRPVHWIPAGHLVGYSGPSRWGGNPTGTHHLRAEESAIIAALALSHAMAVKDRRNYSESVRRMNLAAERDDPDDMLIDVMVALEALMTRKEGPELAYRLALKCAAVLGQTPSERCAYFEIVSEAYGLRSVLVHGGPRKARGGVSFEVRLGEAMATSLDVLQGLLANYLHHWAAKPEQDFYDAVDLAVISGEPIRVHDV